MSTRKNPTPSVRVKFVAYTFLILFPIILIILSELTFWGLYKVTHNKYFENLQETEKNSGFTMPPYERLNFISELNSFKQKIAIFGGSSAAGYGSPLNFGDLLEDSATIVHNYAVPGQPFVGFQAELLELVLPKYDVIIIYAGHNEIWSYLYRKSYREKKLIHLPDGNTIDAAPIYKGHMDKLNKITALINTLKINNDMAAIKVFDNFDYQKLLSSSRTLNIVRRIITKINNGLKTTVTENQETSTNISKLPFYVDKPFISDIEKVAFAKDFLEELTRIRTLLRPNQQLIISTVMANDLYPPNLDSLGGAPFPDSIKHSVEQLYAVLSEEKSLPRDQIMNLPEGAHKKYLAGMGCLGVLTLKTGTQLMPPCLSDLKGARDSDVLPYRVISGVNTAIKSLAKSASNVSVVDPDFFLNQVDNSKDYLSHFVDFQHPSDIGHILIATQISHVLQPQRRHDYIKYNNCGSYGTGENVQSEGTDIGSEKLRAALNTNISWLRNQLNMAAVSWMHEYYLTQALDRMGACFRK
jgi:hypothetical protein